MGEPGSANLFADDRFDLDPAEVRRRVASGEAQLIDVREQHEWDAGRAPGARHIEIERLGWNAPTLDPTVPLIFQCRLGIRGALAAHAFRSIGFDACNTRGGFQAWFDAGLPIEPLGGQVSEH